ncbi:unnamed protein product [Brassicogethes aeneus]|uniref:Uncharacterized protein n=1 Tax=Brassicogethes aeneus TaxID=1431903 RepID=A0A9P0FBE8_BRAAE|nr:unnamed protein product [Brassicogethes aeneus]
MGRPKNETKWEQIEKALLLHKDSIIRDCTIVPRTDEIWAVISNQIANAASAYSLWTSVKKNYNNIQNTLKLPPIQLSCNGANETLEFAYSSDEDVEQCSPDRENHPDCDYENFDFDKKLFSVNLTSDEFMNLLPHKENYKRTGAMNESRKSNQRHYIVFQQRHWTRLLYNKLDPQLRALQIPCSIIFKRNKFYASGVKNYATMEANCRECGADFLCIIKDLPEEDHNTRIDVFMKKECLISHKHDMVRPISDAFRQQISQKLVDTNIAPSQYRRLMAAKSKIDGPVPKLGALRQAKYELVKKQRLDNDPIMAIWKMKVESNYAGAIQNIGLDPFFVYFWDNTQIHAYNKFCESEYSKICVDATGGVVHKIKKTT